MENKATWVKLRDATVEDLKDFKFVWDEKCAVCDLKNIVTIGAYRLSDWYSCRKCCLRDMKIEVEDGLK